LHEICPYKFGAKVRLIYEILKHPQLIVTDLTISLPKSGNRIAFKVLVGRDNGELFSNGLGNDQSIKRVFMKMSHKLAVLTNLTTD
jgi:hypothetical protein